MPDPTGMQKVGYVFEVGDQGSKPLGKIEKAYAGVVKQMDTLTKKMPKVMNRYSESTREAAAATEEAGEKQEKHTSKLGEAAKALKKDSLSLDKLGISWNNLIKILAAVSVGAAIYGVYKLFKGMIEKAFELQKQIAKLNEVYHLHGKESAVVASAVVGMTYRFGQTREEALGLTKAMLDLGMKPRKGFKSLAFTLQEISAATGISGEAVAKFGDEVKTVMRLPDISIRKLGAAIKFVSDESRISADELMGMTGTISKLVLLSGSASDKVRTDLAASLFGLAGALKDADVNAEAFFGTVAEMQLGRISEAGMKAAAALGMYSSMTEEGLFALAKADPAKLMDELANVAGRFNTESEHGIYELKNLGEAFGMTYTDMVKIREKSAKGQGKFFQQAAEAARKESKRGKAAAEAAAARQARLEGMANRFRAIWDRISLLIGGKLLRVIEQKLLPPVSKFLKQLTAKDINKALDDTVVVLGHIGTAFKWIGKIGGWVFGQIGKGLATFASVFTNVFGAFVALVDGNTDKAKRLFIAAFDGVIDFLGGPWFKKFIGIWKKHIWPAIKGFHQVIWENLKAGAKKLWGWMKTASVSMVMLMLSPFMAISDAIQGQIDKLLVWLATKIAPKLSKIPIPGMASIGAALEGAGVEAEARIKTREEAKKREAEQRLAEVRSRVGAASSVSFPSSMVTSSPTGELLMRDMAGTLRDIKNQGSVGSQGASPSAAKAAFVYANS